MGFLCMAIKVIVVILITLLAPSSATFQCYECSGVLCTSTKVFATVDCATEMCFVLSLFGSEVHRGCYGSGMLWVHECNKYRTSRCAVCNTELCNKEVFSQGIITCRICDRGICSEDTKELGFFQMCPRFRYPELPRCVTIVDPWTMEYTFGCYNQLTIQQNALCEKDYTESVCRICDTPNCNNQFFYPFNKRLSCNTAKDGDPRLCSSSGTEFGYYGCYKDSRIHNKAQYGCFNELFNSTSDYRYELLWTDDNHKKIEVCPGDLCNVIDLSDIITFCGGGSCPVMRDKGGLCARYHYKADTGVEVISHKCLSRYPCWRASECDSVCRGVQPTAKPCYSSMRMECFNCEDCPQVNPDSPLQGIVCNDTSTCVMVVAPGNRVVRGCYSGTAGSLCDQYVGQCVKCNTARCNHAPAIVYCHQCSPYNPMCAYTQMETLSYECEGIGERTMTYSFTARAMCFSAVDAMGKVTRGCTLSDSPCPHGLTCTKCEGNYCNYESYVSANCIECTGSFASACANNLTYLSSKKILKSCPVPYDTPHCYLTIHNTEIKRGCVSDQHYKEVFLVSCSYTQDCFFCEGESCNYFTIFIRAASTTVPQNLPQYRIEKGRLKLRNCGHFHSLGAFIVIVWTLLCRYPF